jgi:SAM-dependent methyltransferase
MPDRLAALDLVEGLHLGHAVFLLHDEGVLLSMRRPITAEALAVEHGMDADLLRGVLHYVAARTDLVRRSGAKFVTTREYSPAARFLLDHYAGAYGAIAVRLAKVLHDPASAPSFVDGARYARAFDAASEGTVGALPGIVRQLELRRLLDVGCGSGALLVELARGDPGFVGWGIDANRAMCAAARRRIRAARVGSRVKVWRGDVADLEAALPEEVRAAVDAVAACDVLNEMFAHGSARAVAWLRALRSLLQGRVLLVADYYGRLGTRRAPPPRASLLHDYAQLVSGQGVPPADLAGWRGLYSKAGCRLVHAIEDRATTRFVHILALGPGRD